jgi:hypothetical protein
MYRASSGHWTILETSLRHLPVREAPPRESQLAFARRASGLDESAFFLADQLARDQRRVQYVPVLCLNHRGVWTVEECQPGTVDAASRFQPDWAAGPSFKDIWRHERKLAQDHMELATAQALLE